MSEHADAMHLWSGFRDPPMEYRPGLRWWWPGGAVEVAELRRELAEMVDAGFGGAEIAMIRLAVPEAYDTSDGGVDDVFTDGFFRKVGQAIAAGGRLGMWVDYTLGSGWPFGGGHITPELASMELTSSFTDVSGPVELPFENVPADPAVQPPALNPETAAFSERIKDAFCNPDAEPSQEWRAGLSARRRLVTAVLVELADEQPGETSESSDAPTPGGIPGWTPPKPPTILRSESARVVAVEGDEPATISVPLGEWRLFALYAGPSGQRVSTGAGPGPRLVVNHLDAVAMASHLGHVGGRLFKVLDNESLGRPRSVFTDSLELDAWLPWCDDFVEQFEARRGYDIRPHLPVIKAAAQPGFVDYSGREVVTFEYGDADAGARIRNDYWTTVGELISERCYAQVAQWARDNGVLSRIQAHGAPANTSHVYGLADIPETEDLYAGSYDFYKVATSTARVLGRPLVSSETYAHPAQPYRLMPERLKQEADELLASGVGQIIYHGYPYVRSGLADPGWHPWARPICFAEHFNGRNPIWRHLRPGNDYIARMQYLVRRTEDAARVAILRSEDFYPMGRRVPELNVALFDAGHDFAYFDHSVLSRARVEDGRLVAPSGSTFDVLVVSTDRTLTPTMEANLARLVRDGLRIVDVGTGATAVANLGAALADVTPVLPILGPRPETLFFAERCAGHDRFLLLRNVGSDPVTAHIDAARLGELERWDPWSGERAEVELDEDGALRLALPGFASAVLRARPGAQTTRALSRAEKQRAVVDVDGPWTIRELDTGAEATVGALAPLPEIEPLAAAAGDIYYSATVEVEAPIVAIDLGQCRGVAELRVHGNLIGARVMRPYHFELPAAVPAGIHTIELTITVPLVNRMLVTAPPPENALFANRVPEALGLLGPVRVETSGE